MEHSLEIRKSRNAVLCVRDRVTVYQLPKFKELLYSVGKRLGDRKCLILDLSEASYLDPLALGVIVAFSRTFRERGGDLKIVNANGELGRIFEESRLSKVYETYGSAEEAERSISR
jgi:anti-anti-sigma factor